MKQLSISALISSSTLILAFTAGCPGSGGSSSGGGGTCGQYYDALLSYYNRCGNQIASLDNSRGRFEDLCGRLLSAPGAANLAGDLATCSGEYNAAACGDSPDCEPGGGTFADGAACGESFQCQSSLCQKGNDAPCGTCGTRVPVGGNCGGGSASERCVKGASCVQTGSATGKCTAKTIGKAGDECASSSTTIVECDKGLHCFFPSNSSTPNSAKPTCRAPAQQGGDCSSRSDCVSGLGCVKQKCAPPIPEGAECAGFSSSDCAPGLACDKTCKRTTTVAAGQDCDLVRRCARGSCRGMSFSSAGGVSTVTPGKCVDPLPDGAACKSSSSSSNEEEPSASCDVFAECINGICTVPDPAACK